MTSSRPIAESSEVFLSPGETAFLSGNASISTILGSCVSVTLWHPARRLGGMCHFLLPTRVTAGFRRLDGRYGDEAMALLRRALDSAQTHPGEFEAGVFGGANMFPGLNMGIGKEIGRRNIETARELVQQHGFRVVYEHVGGTNHRRIVFDLSVGTVQVRQAADDVPPWIIDPAQLVLNQGSKR